MPRKKGSAKKSSFTLSDTIKAVKDVFTVIKENKTLLTDLIMHPVETVKKDIHLMIASGLFLAMGMLFLLLSVAEYLVETQALTKAAAYGLMGLVMVALAALMKVVRKN
jgi:hypothetical protein